MSATDLRDLRDIHFSLRGCYQISHRLPLPLGVGVGVGLGVGLGVGVGVRGKGRGRSRSTVGARA